MGSLGMPEILMILVVALIIFGPRKLPELGKTLGQSLAQFRKASDDFKRQWEDEVVSEKRRLESEIAQEPARESEQAATAADDSAPADQNTSNAIGESATAEEPATVPTVEPAPATVSREQVAAQETKRDWM
jgi:TatA/E family protein of Tat protein translocase